MPVEIQLACANQTLPTELQLQKWADAALEIVGEGSLCVRVVDADEGKSLNNRFRRMDKPTNVLSFPTDRSLPGETLWGDVVICAPVVFAEAIDQGKRPDDHFAHMVIHGVLHLLGYDHGTRRSAEQMEVEEKRILELFGVADPYTEI
ncbi:MAG: rRNA maturation RNase YbeY [Gammaproteobacteria bacterium]|nr:rRNA maturation RNase YbeY [Gammaproteobacteria bacterium]